MQRPELYGRSLKAMLTRNYESSRSGGPIYGNYAALAPMYGDIEVVLTHPEAVRLHIETQQLSDRLGHSVRVIS